MGVHSSATSFIKKGLLDGKAQYTVTDASASTAHSIARGNKSRSISRSDILAVIILVIIDVASIGQVLTVVPYHRCKG
jgi:hypothetical protein